MLRKQLKSLPATLPQTYERILVNIEEKYSKYALKMLQWLTYSNQPLSLLELAEVVAIDEDEEPRFDPERRFPEPRDILLMCSSLVTATEEKDRFWETYFEPEIERAIMIRLAHFSVKEYLISSHIIDGAARKYSIQEIDANVRIARDCLSYILYFTEDIPKPARGHEVDEYLSSFPLARYAQLEWIEHVRVGRQINEEPMVDLIMEFFSSEGNAWSTGLLGELGARSPPWGMELSELPLYYASQMGLLGVAKRLITIGVEGNAYSGNYANALRVASLSGNTEIVKLLLETGADPNSSKHGWKHDWELGSAVYWASLLGHGAIVRLLLDAGAEVRLEKSLKYHSALHAAASNGNSNLVAMLISSGMDVNLNPGKGLLENNTALGLASIDGHAKVVKLLVEAGASPDLTITALHLASRRGHNEVIELLLSAGTNPNQSCKLATPLRQAVKWGRLTTVKMLLDAGADVNLGGSWRDACFLTWVPLKKRREVLDLLVAAGAEMIGAEEMIKKI